MPMKLRTSRSVVRRLPNGDEGMEMYMSTDDGEVRAMEMLYQRQGPGPAPPRDARRGA
ncbi:MAG TPA: hypothetical protein PKJ99_14100 [Thermoanaerobaculales bacterium]|nr:hypothetical protein [Thermoanaerobaculales bacterium]HPA81858.1 hypothetical protein [Thermoanaerobaculales bacterium]HQN97335.1 hypothetical protein [Thermoanaerobaculales bacterium]HQP42950.1 hypothetical protein [Thermoanaerobaculales bacterium]